MSKANPRYANGSKRRKIRESLKRGGGPCAICGAPIDYSLPYGDPMSFEVDEIIPVSRYAEGGYASAKACALDINNCQPTHRICNQRKGNNMIDANNNSSTLTLPLSRHW